jgi:hypothetical protein
MMKRGKHDLSGWESWIDGAEVSLRKSNERTTNRQQQKNERTKRRKNEKKTKNKERKNERTKSKQKKQR